MLRRDIYLIYFIIMFVENTNYTVGFSKTLTWNGGPLHVDCEHTMDLWTTCGKYIRENIIAIKAVTYKDDIYVITPRLKRGVLATVWLIVQSKGIELQPYPYFGAHDVGDCEDIQNAVDVHLDHLGNLWVLDSGIVDTSDLPRCTCPPRVVMISTLFGDLNKIIDLSTLTEPTSLLQNVIVEYGLGGKPFIYISDAARGSIIVYDTKAKSGWLVPTGAPTMGLQIALVKKNLNPVLIIVRLHQPGLVELDTAVLKRKKSVVAVRVFGEQMKPVIILGFDIHHVYFRHMECADVLSWDARRPYEDSHLLNIHSAGPRLLPMSVAPDALHALIVLDTSYADAFRGRKPAYHRISFVAKKDILF